MVHPYISWLTKNIPHITGVVHIIPIMYPKQPGSFFLGHTCHPNPMSQYPSAVSMRLQLRSSGARVEVGVIDGSYLAGWWLNQPT